MSQAKYFREELSDLQQQGKYFSQLFPQLARYLDQENSDPDVARLLEGFAFLTGRIREKIDDEFPELTHGLINMLWPNYLRPIPGFSIVKFAIDQKAADSFQLIEKGSELASTPTEGTSCRFSCCRSVEVYPLSIDDVKVCQQQYRRSISLQISCNNSRSLAEVNPKRLSLYLSGDRFSAEMLYLALAHQLTGITIKSGEQQVVLPASACRELGFSKADQLLPGSDATLSGFSILQDYLAFPEAFFQFELSLEDIEFLSFGRETSGFAVVFCFNEALDEAVQVDVSSFEMFCTPIINLFQKDLPAINVTGKQAEYPLQADMQHPEHYEVFSVDTAQGWLSSKPVMPNLQRNYYPFESFRHQHVKNNEKSGLFYQIKPFRSLRFAGFEYRVAFVRQDELALQGNNETIALQGLCSNRFLPQGLAKGQINQPSEYLPVSISYQNIIPVTAPVWPKLEGDLLWTLISNNALNYISLLSRESLVSLLQAYDFRAQQDHNSAQLLNKRIEAIDKVESDDIDLLLRGMPVRGIRTTLTLDQSAFVSLGGLYLFANVLRHFFASFCPVNSFHQLKVIEKTSQRCWLWQPLNGLQQVM